MLGHFVTEDPRLLSFTAAGYPPRVRFWCSLSLFLAGCLAPPAGEAPRVRTGNAWADCYRRFEPGSDPGSDLARLGALCAAPARLSPLGPAHHGAAQTEGSPPEHLDLRARKGRCYRAFAVGGAGVDDLDVAIHDAAGHLVAGDVSRDRWPVVPPRGPLCAERDGVYTITVGVARGSGDYDLQVWGSDAP